MEPDQAWDVYFSTLCSWHLHPGYQRENAVRPSLREIADLADAMMMVRNERIHKWE